MDPVEMMGGGANIFLRLAAAALVGAVLGLNRDLRHKPAGLRLHALVALGAALATVTGVQLAYVGPRMDAAAVTSVVQGTVTAVGFLGGGVILHGDSGGRVQGLTTAASIWVAAVLGIACGAGQWVTAVAALALTLVILVLGGPLEAAVHRRVHRHEAAAAEDDA